MIQNEKFEQWANSLPDKELVRIFYDHFDPSSIQEYLYDEWKSQGKPKSLKEEVK